MLPARRESGIGTLTGATWALSSCLSNLRIWLGEIKSTPLFTSPRRPRSIGCARSHTALCRIDPNNSCSFYCVGNSLGILGHRDEGPHGKNMSLRPWGILVVEADRAIGAKIIGVSRLGRTQALNSIRTPACSYLSLSI